MSVAKRLTEIYYSLEKRKVLKTKKEFAKYLGIDFKNINKYLNGSVKFTVSETNFDKINALNINIRWLLSGQGSMFNDEKLNITDKEVEEKNKLNEEITELKKQLEKYKPIIEDYPELKKMVAELEKDNAQLSKELMERLRQIIDLKDNNKNNSGNKLGLNHG